MYFSELIVYVFFIAVITSAEDVDNKHLQCLVCKAMVQEMKNETSSIDPKRKMEIGNYRLDAEGNELRKKVPMAQSKIHLSSVMDEVCERFNHYLGGNYDSNGKLTIFPLRAPDGSLNPKMAKVEVNQDLDRDKSLKFLCEEIIVDHEELIIEHFINHTDDIIEEICTRTTEICNENMPSDDVDDDEDYKKLKWDDLAPNNEL